MKNKSIYIMLCHLIGYRIVFRDYYDVETFTLRKKNSHMALIKYIGKPDENGHIKIEQIFQIQIKPL